jgi:signal peptidase I
VLAHARSAARLTLQLLTLLAIATAFFLRIPQVTGPSMLPDVTPGELVLIDTLAYRLGGVRRGDVVALRHDEPTAQTFIKRVVALPGERVAIDRGVVEIDGRRIAEPYVSFGDTRSVPPVVVPPGDLYVLGDNRSQSEDSRDWGPVPEADVIGKAVFGLWPPRAMK